MDRIFFENIRCFATRQEARLAPLTLLVGENSSGKSTFLALVRIAWDLVNLAPANFNEEPFLLGTYEQVISAFGKNLEYFSLGLQAGASRDSSITIRGDFGTELGLPFLSAIRIGSSLGEADLHALLPSDFPLWANRHIDLATKMLVLMRVNGVETSEELEQTLESLGETLGSRPYAFAPFRTRPQRTYDPVGGGESSEGSHVPAMLASMAFYDPAKTQGLFAALDSFGKKSGLFDRVGVRRLGESESDPFQIQVRLGGNAVNLIDVGYGVSQVLPIVVDCLRGQEGGTFLLQQPEVHLHPSAQAELGSFLGVLAKQQNKRFVIETHSDYLVDRIRMDIRDGKGLKPEDVSLLYFERTNGKAQIHALELDDQGNILDPPPGYRRFFLEEERRLLGI